MKKVMILTAVFVFITLMIFAPKLLAQNLPATCTDLVTTANVWGNPAKGVDLRDYTNSTLHWIGCPSDGCHPDEFFCNYNVNTETLSFGTTVNDALRAVVDPGNVQGDAMPTSYSGCCSSSAPFDICNAPDANNNGVSIDAAVALCNALGYQNGSLTWVNSNGCPEVHATSADGSDWTSDFVNSSGYGQTYTCTGFQSQSTQVPTMTEWGMIIFTTLAGLGAVYYLRKYKRV